jgi:hypothetical protein
VHVQVDVARLGIDEPDGPRLCAEHRHELLQERAAQRLYGRRRVEQRGHVVQHGKLAVFFFQRARLARHPAFERGVQVLQVGRHAIEPIRERAELVLGFDRQPHVEFAVCHALHAFRQFFHRTHDQHEHEVDQGDRSSDGERHQSELHVAQQLRVVRVAALDGAHHLVDAAHEGVDVRAQPAHPLRALGEVTLQKHVDDARAQLLRPVHRDVLHVLLDFRLARQRERPAGIATLQDDEDVLQPVHFREQLGAHRLVGMLQVRGQQVGNAVRAHALAAHVVDHGGAAFELPGLQQRVAYGGQRHGEQAHRHPDELEAQTFIG